MKTFVHVLREHFRQMFEGLDELQEGYFDADEVFGFGGLVEVVVLDVVQFEHLCFRDVLEVFAVVGRREHEVLF
jgi:hypothetical protein